MGLGRGRAGRSGERGGGRVRQGELGAQERRARGGGRQTDEVGRWARGRRAQRGVFGAQERRARGGGRGDAAVAVRRGETLGLGSAVCGRGGGRPPPHGGGASRSRTPAVRVSMSERMFHVKHSAWAWRVRASCATCFVSSVGFFSGSVLPASVVLIRMVSKRFRIYEQCSFRGQAMGAAAFCQVARVSAQKRAGSAMRGVETVAQGTPSAARSRNPTPMKRSLSAMG